MASPLSGLRNHGNTCWAAATLQCLRSLPALREACPANTPLGRMLNADAVGVDVVADFFAWCQSCLKNNEGKRGRPADPAEFLVELLDRDDVPSGCFGNKKTSLISCETCKHTRKTCAEEKMLILTTLPRGPSPIRRAVDKEFGFSQANTSGEPVQQPKISGEVWIECNDAQLIERDDPEMISGSPYVIFYHERGVPVTMGESSAASSEEVGQSPGHPRELDCDAGKCLGTKQPHVVRVESYEMGPVLAVHVACPPKNMHMGYVERTLLTRSTEPSDDPADQTGFKAYDLVSFISRVGGCHYVAFRKKTSSS